MSDTRVSLGSVRVRVRDVARSEAFYTTTLGLTVRERLGSLVFLSAGEEHHALALDGVGIEEGGVAQHVGMSTVSWQVPDAWEFWRMHRRLDSAGVKFDALDEGVRWTLRFRDPDGNALEIFVDARALPGGQDEWSGTPRKVDESAILSALQSQVPGIFTVD